LKTRRERGRGMDESTDITDVCQLMTFDINFEIKKDFLKLQPVTTGTKGLRCI
jgi:hypothetical protein